MSVVSLLLGRPLSNREAEGDKVGVPSGVPAMGLDALSSACYGPEAALAMLAGTGAAGLAVVGPITAAIVALLVTLAFSYWQTIAAYPNSGGSYTVARENLGLGAGLLAAAALMLDYVLTVAVGISAGAGALTSAFPALQAATLPLCLAILVVVTLVNLHGTREAGLAWAVPTYLFILCLGAVVAWGVAKVGLAGTAHAVVAPPPIGKATQAVGLWLVLRTFASGCTAMTGVEAISNGVNAFREPRVKRAHATLAFVVLVLSVMLLGIAHLAQRYGIMAMDQTKPGYQSVVSQLVGAVFGRGWFYYLTSAGVLAVLCLSANTSFVGFPRLCALVARDDFLPRSFAVPGRRMVMTASVLFLSASAALLLILFGGITDKLIPLFAIGAFLAFTLSQAGMAIHWRHRLRRPEKAEQDGKRPRRAAGSLASRHGARAKLAINGTGAVATGIAFAVILAAKFAEGAWISLVIIPATLFLLRAIHRYYRRVDERLLDAGGRSQIDLRGHAAPVVLVPIERWDMLSRKAIHYAMRLSPDVTALHVATLQGSDDDAARSRLKAEWRELVAEPARRAGRRAPRLNFVPSPYRSVLAPLLRAIAEAGQRYPGRPILVVLPELVEKHWLGRFLHTHRERRLRERLLRFGGPHIGVLCVPWQIARESPRQGIAEEEPRRRRRLSPARR